MDAPVIRGIGTELVPLVLPAGLFAIERERLRKDGELPDRADDSSSIANAPLPQSLQA